MKIFFRVTKIGNEKMHNLVYRNRKKNIPVGTLSSEQNSKNSEKSFRKGSVVTQRSV